MVGRIIEEVEFTDAVGLLVYIVFLESVRFILLSCGGGRLLLFTDSI